jgi:16S rRNA (cytosine1402-N4)-methyltransferase
VTGIHRVGHLIGRRVESRAHPAGHRSGSAAHPSGNRVGSAAHRIDHGEHREDGDHPGGTGKGDGMSEQHVPVLAARVAQLLAPALSGRPAVLVDGTLGLGGHTLALLAAHPGLRVVGIDRDPDALRIAGDRLAGAGYAGRVRLVHAVYDRIGDAVDGPVDAVLFDLGVSSMQLDRADRGFTYASDAPLDMRMDPSAGPTAADVLNGYPESDLVRVLREYGEERFASRIARAVVAERRRAPLHSTARLVELVRAAVPAAARRTGGHPAKRTFQALRIEVNDELGALRRAIPAALEVLRTGGRIAVLSYQSLEDRIVKRAIAPLTVSDAPVDLPVDLPGHAPTFRWLTRGAEPAGESEVALNPRAASVRLRAAERVREAR